MANPDPPKLDLSKFGIDVSKIRSTPGNNPFAGTREVAIADSANRIAEFQKALPNVDFKAAIVEPTVNFYYDMKEKLDSNTYNKHQDLMKEMMNYLMPPGDSYPFTYPPTSETEPTSTGATNPTPENDDSTKSDQADNKKNTEEEPSSSEKLALAEATFWKARDILTGNEEVLKLFDSVYLRPDRPVEVMLEQLQECFTHIPQVHAALAASGKAKEDSRGADTKAAVHEEAPVTADEGN